MSPNQAQSEAWNGEEATHYIANADRYDRQLAAFTKVLMKHARIAPTDRVLDIGCGCGATTLQAALRARAVLAADISDPMVRTPGAGRRQKNSKTRVSWSPMRKCILSARASSMFS